MGELEEVIESKHQAVRNVMACEEMFVVTISDGVTRFNRSPVTPELIDALHHWVHMTDEEWRKHLGEG